MSTTIFKPRTKEELMDEVDKYLEGNSEYIIINDWDTSLITDMSHLFEDAPNFNDPIGNWDTSNVTNMSFMFSDTNSFNQPINSWNTSNVTNMNSVFANAIAFNQYLDHWDTSNVTNMIAMFAYSGFNNTSIKDWNIKNVEDMREMFIDSKFTHYTTLLKWYNINNLEQLSPRRPITVAKGYVDIFPDNNRLYDPMQEAMDNGAIIEYSPTPPPVSTNTTTTLQNVREVFDSIQEMPLSKSRIKVTRKNKAYNFKTFEEENIIRTIHTNLDARIFYYNNQYYNVSRNSILGMINNTSPENKSIKYECHRVGAPTQGNVNFNDPYFPARSIGLYGLFRLSQLKYMLRHPEIRIVEIVSNPIKKVASVVGHDLYTNDHSDSHCQEGLSENVFELKHVTKIQERMTIQNRSTHIKRKTQQTRPQKNKSIYIKRKTQQIQTRKTR